MYHCGTSIAVQNDIRSVADVIIMRSVADVIIDNGYSLGIVHVNMVPSLPIERSILHRCTQFISILSIRLI